MHVAKQVICRVRIAQLDEEFGSALARLARKHKISDLQHSSERELANRQADSSGRLLLRVLLEHHAMRERLLDLAA